MSEIDVIIPVYKPDQRFITLIGQLDKQTVPINRIILMNTEQKYFERLIYGTSFLSSHPNMTVHHLSSEEFDHGETRNNGVKKSDASVFIMMTQDAVPKDDRLIENLIKPLEDEHIAVSYARQLPSENSGETEYFIRQFNYPPDSMVKSQKDLQKLGIKTYFCSNVCAAYRREIFDRLGGFVRKTIFNEDMIYASTAVKAGYKIAYTAEAQVIHSHDYTCKQQFHRNFDLGVSQTDHPDIFRGLPSEGEGIALIKKATSFFWKSGKKRKIPGLYLNSICKYAGFVLGKKYTLLPGKLVLRCTMNKRYWK